MQVTIDFNFDSIPNDDYDIVENVAKAILDAINHSEKGIAPEDTFTKSFKVFDAKGRSVDVDCTTGKLTY